ncbi:MAG: hypothetical protein Q8730_02565, partial [Sweet potato little leaf phytoplasma]|nr:hypothetical protein [Sweet potato little leaf phytoplasma]
QEANLPFDGKMTLYDGRTGEPYDNSISVGILYMLKLSHKWNHNQLVQNCLDFYLFFCTFLLT